MNIVNFGTERTMTSREIADLIGKKHKHVLAEIEEMLYELCISPTDFAVALPDSHGQMKPCFQLPKRETLILLTRIPSPMCQRVIDRWEAWEAGIVDRWDDLETGIVERWEALETGKATPAAVQTNRASEDMAVLAALADGLRLEGSARLGVMRKGMEIVAPHLLPAMDDIQDKM